MEAFIPVGFLLILGLLTCVAIFLISSLLGPRNPIKSKLGTYECGVNPEGDARMPFSIKFYVIAVMFLLIDVEAVFFFPWALVYRESLAKDGTLFYGMCGYVFFFVLALVYILRKGSLRVR